MAAHLFGTAELLSYLLQIVLAAAYAWFLEKMAARIGVEPPQEETGE